MIPAPDNGCTVVMLWVHMHVSAHVSECINLYAVTVVALWKCMHALLVVINNAAGQSVHNQLHSMLSVYVHCEQCHSVAA